MTVIREVRSEAALSPEKNRNSAALSWFGRRFGALPGDRREPLRANAVASGGNNPNQIDEV